MKDYAIQLADGQARAFDAIAKEYGYTPNEFLELIAKEMVEPNRVKMQDIARVAGVSNMAVSFTLNGVKGQISDAKRALIWATAKRLGWRPNILARALRSKGRSALPSPEVLHFPKSTTSK